MGKYQYPYGFTSDVFFPPLELELFTYLHHWQPAKGGLGKAAHFRKAAEILWPEKHTCHFQWHPWAEKMLEMAVEHQYLGILGCANSGKTDFSAIWAIINWLCAPKETLVLTTSTSLQDSRKRIWGRIKHYFEGATKRLPGKVVDSVGIIRTDDGSGKFDDAQGISLIAGEKKKEREAIDKMIGLKNQRVFMIADELPELSEAILEACFSNLSVNPYFQLIGIGNFKSMYDPLGVFVEPEAGYASITPEDTEWKTKRGYCIRFDGLKSPNILQGEDKYPVYNSKNLKQHRLVLGENTIGFWRMVRSFPCPAGAENAIYTEADLAHSAEPFRWRETPVRICGFDPAFTSGGDRPMMVTAYLGFDIDNLQILVFDKMLWIKEDVNRKMTPRNVQIAEDFVNQCKQLGLRPKEVAMDVTGGGTVFYDLVTEKWGSGILAVNFSGAASARIVNVNDPRPASEHYTNRMSEIWHIGQEFLRYHQLRGIPPDLAMEMKARKYDTVKGKSMRIVVEPKKEMKARMGYSPDIADAYFVLLDLAVSRFNFQAGTRNSGRARVRLDLQREQRLSQRPFETIDYSEQPLQSAAYVGDF